MSVSVHWAPVQEKPPPTIDGGTAFLWRMLLEAIHEGGPEIELRRLDHLRIIRAMAVANPVNRFFEQIANRLEQYGTIKMWAEY